MLARAGPRRPVCHACRCIEELDKICQQLLPVQQGHGRTERRVHRQRAASAVTRPQRGGLPGRCYPPRSRKPASRWRNRKATAAA